MSRLVGFEWDAENAYGFNWEDSTAKQVCWGTPNGNLAEASVHPGGAWQLTALNAVSNAPLASLAGITAYGWRRGNSKQVSYITEGDDHIHEIYFVFPDKNWKHADLTQITGAPTAIATGESIAAYAHPSGGTKQVAFLGSGGNVHELSVGIGKSWKHVNLTTKTGCPEPDVSGYFSSYFWGAYYSKQVVYTTNDGHVHELYVVSAENPLNPWQQWKHFVLPGLTH